MILLSDEKMTQIINKEHNLRGVRDSDRAIAKEQLKQVVKWLRMEIIVGENQTVIYPPAWQALLKEIE